MKGILSLTLLAALFSTANSHASTINKIEVFPPFLNVGCSDLKTDNVGSMGISLNKLVVKESESKITVSVDQTLKVCELKINDKDEKSLSWKAVNPNKGFEVQYFDFKTSSIKTRTEVINSDSKSNRFEVSMLNEENNLKVTSTLTDNKSSNVADLEISKLNVLNQNDIDTLDTGKEIRKRIVLFNVLNLTTIVDGEKIELGDLPYSGRNVFITFGKSQNLIKVKSVSVQ